MSELVSVVMPSYNSAAFIAASIESVLAQTYKHLELLVADDASQDDTVAIVRAYQQRDARIRLFVLEGNEGAGAARNKCIEAARGRYIAFCDSDDTWEPTKLAEQVAFMQAGGYSFVFSSYYVMNKSGERLGTIHAPASVSLTDTKRDDKIGFLTAIYDVQAVGKLYMPLIRKRQDWAYVLMILQKCQKAYALPQPLATYRKGRGSISHNKFSLVKYNLKVYEIVFGYSPLRARLYFTFLFMPHYMLKRAKYVWHSRRSLPPATEEESVEGL